MINKQLIDTVIPPFSYLKPSSGGFHGSFNGNFADIAFFIMDKEINELHPNLAIAMRIIALDDLVVSSGGVKKVLLLWTKSLYMTNTDGENIAISKAFSISLSERSLSIVGNAITYDEECIPGTKHVLKIPGTRSYANIEVETSWLDTQYPEWRLRFAIAEDLGLAPFNVLQSVLNEERPAEVIDAPNDLIL